jgi:hypothetical protein
VSGVVRESGFASMSAVVVASAVTHALFTHSPMTQSLEREHRVLSASPLSSKLHATATRLSQSRARARARVAVGCVVFKTGMGSDARIYDGGRVV